MSETKKLMDVRVGDQWRDNDSRHGDDGRRFAVASVYEERVQGHWISPNGEVGRLVNIRRSRFRPNSTGYALVSRSQPTDYDDRLVALALNYHKTVEGEYGCPGASCPGVQRLVELLQLAIKDHA